jgi:hypothetical protein
VHSGCYFFIKILNPFDCLYVFVCARKKMEFTDAELSPLLPRRIRDKEGMEIRMKRVVSFLAGINLVS